MSDNDVRVKHCCEDGKDEDRLDQLEEDTDGAIVVGFDLSHVFFEWLQVIDKFGNFSSDFVKDGGLALFCRDLDIVVSQKVDTGCHLLLQELTLSFLFVSEKLLPHFRVHYFQRVSLFAGIGVQDFKHTFNLNLGFINLPLNFDVFLLDLVNLIFESFLDLKDLLVFFFKFISPHLEKSLVFFLALDNLSILVKFFLLLL